MNNTENPGTSSWTRIQSGVRETERLIGQKKYNLAMIKARQTLEFMVKCLCERTGAIDGSLIDMIDSLYEEQAISKTTFEHYHKIRTIGNKAIHEEDNSAYNANQAYHLLSQEVHTFASDHNDHGDRRRKPSAAARSQGMQSQRRGAPARRANPNYSHRRRAHASGPSFDLRSLIKPLLLIAIIVVLIFIIKMIRPSKPKVDNTSAPAQTQQVSTAPPESESSPETTAPATTAAPSTAAVVKYKTNDTVNLRSTPDTSKDRVGVLPPDTTVEYIAGSDKKDSTGKTWCKIKHNGQEAYMVKDYLTPVS